MVLASQVSLVILLMLGQSSSPVPKTRQPAPKSTVTVIREAPEDERQDPGMPEEMRTRLAIERAEIEHKKILSSAEKVGDLTAQIHKIYSETGKLTSDEIKKLGEVEKLAKRILTHSGGDLTADDPGGHNHLTLTEAIDRLSEVGASVKKSVSEKTRFVVSMQIISDSNHLVHLVQFIRKNNKQQI